MEILEFLFAATQMCGCFLEVGAALADSSAVVAGYRMHKQYRQVKANPEAPGPKLSWRRTLPFVLLVFVAVFLTTMSAWKFLR